MQSKKVLEAIVRNPKSVRFKILRNLLLHLGFRERKGKGSHRVYIKSGISEIITLQNVEGKVKPYQVRQVVRIIAKYSLIEGDNNE